jgi:hypothetical protein
MTRVADRIAERLISRKREADGIPIDMGTTARFGPTATA